MDISSIASTGNAYITQAAQQIKQQDNEVGSFQSALEQAVADSDKQEIRKACVEFESYFIQTMFKEMRKTVDTSGRFVPKSFAEGVFEEMLDEETSKSLAKTGGIGLADMMYTQLTQNL
jgi:flagellar protein FlgJ